MGEGIPDRAVDARAARVPRTLLVALAFVVVAMVALPLLARPFLPGVPDARALSASGSSEHMVGASRRTTSMGALRPPAGSASAAARPVWLVAVAEAQRQVGAPYAAQGDTPQTGFSCVGLVHWSYAQAGVAVPETETDLAAFPAVIGATPQGDGLLPGDILLYRDTAWAGLSHASIYVGDRMMVSADSPATGVRLEPMDDAYWVAHWAMAVRVPAAQRYLPAHVR